MASRWLRSPKRVLTTIYTALAITLCYQVFKFITETPPTSQEPEGCSPTAYANGKWIWDPRTNVTKMTRREQAVEFGGFERCASDREYWWNLAGDNPDQFYRFPKAHSYKWKPSSECTNLRPMDPSALLKDLVEKGGWYFVGDSISENHFFSLSCTLGPHVIATPNHTQHPHFDRAWPQNLYLNPNSPLLTELTFPPGFNISGTPLATVRRIDLLFSQAEINDIHRSIHPHPEDSEDNIFSDEATWTLPLNEYITQFISPLPEARYSTMIVGTAGHWTVSLFNGTTPRGMGGILNLFEVVTKKWASQVQSVVGRTNDDCAAEGSLCKAPRRRVIVRDYLPGHDNCHDHTAPTTEIPPIYSDWDWMNWKYIPKFNNVWKESHSRFVYSLFLTLQSQNLLGAKKYRDIDYLPIGRPGMLRPDGHVTGDCLHVMTGTGMLEGWTHYIWHYITRESS